MCTTKRVLLEGSLKKFMSVIREEILGGNVPSFNELKYGTSFIKSDKTNNILESRRRSSRRTTTYSYLETVVYYIVNRTLKVK